MNGYISPGYSRRVPLYPVPPPNKSTSKGITITVSPQPQPQPPQPQRPPSRILTSQPTQRYIFTYALLSHSHILSLSPHAQFLSLAHLRGFKFLISPRGLANLVLSAPDSVWGAVWLLPPSEERGLENAQPGYEKYELAVHLHPSREELLCQLYVDPIPGTGLPSPAYIEQFNLGLRDTPLPPEYVKNVIRRWIPPPPVGIPTAQEEPARCYFAYGTEMALCVLGQTAPGARALDSALLPGYRWVVGRDGKPNVRPERGSAVWGMVSSVTREDERALDRQFLSGGRGRRAEEVELSNGRGVVRCFFYLDLTSRREALPDPAVGEELVKGMQEAVWEAKLPTEWVEQVVRPWLFPSAAGQ
ncbi:hypothetical protein DACRYDRAFT_105805 [Dacryopinax primogenitus]|uniref:gamma-glutamylcyclotransferase n=1 Tax=Dacryopinax primogenitus (strain DJM 731) TaxID=1858805 RepID=M5GC28_DACPD|nr:uncharacterized protein DACRYDRAFT_105805 [Dacryopinax primogenitus]EJU03642.1 hypothetical protein DACRYDRAFT_105805 [Dacryopinax primogenitus]